MSFHRVQSAALLAGVTILSALSATEANAATTTQTLGFFADTYGDSFGLGPDTLVFNPFNTSLGTLTGVTFDISGFMLSREGTNPTVTVTLGSTTLYDQSFQHTSFDSFLVTATFDGTASGQIPLSAFEGPGTVSTVITVLSETPDYDFGGGNSRNGDFSAVASGLTLTYTYNPTEVSSTPLPAAIWLFGAGAAGLAAISRRRRRSA
jgi:hypothetical protein